MSTTAAIIHMTANEAMPADNPIIGLIRPKMTGESDPIPKPNICRTADEEE